MNLSGLQPWLQPYAEYLVRLGAPYGVKVTSTYRSPTQQAALYANRANNPYPVARPGTSYHEYGRAFDLVAEPAVLAWLGEIWERMGGTWGGHPRVAGHRPDEIHFQA